MPKWPDHSMMAAHNGRPTAAVVALACALALLLSPSVPTLYRLRIGTVLQCTNWREADLLRYPLLVLACAVYAALRRGMWLRFLACRDRMGV